MFNHNLSSFKGSRTEYDYYFNLIAFKMPGVVAPMPKGKTQHYGIEVADKVIWQGWEPGREYIKSIILKNVKVKTQKLKYK